MWMLANRGFITELKTIFNEDTQYEKCEDVKSRQITRSYQSILVQNINNY